MAISRWAALAVVLGFLAVFRASDASASICGPHNRLISVTNKPDGSKFYLCKCVPGYVPISTRTVYGNPPHLPGCARSKRRARKPAKSRKKHARGTYRAKPARNAPRKRKKHKAPTPAAASRKAPVPRPDKTRFARKDVAAGSLDVPVPRLGAQTWSKGFPDEKAAAALHLSRQGYDQLRKKKRQSAKWLGDQGKEKGKEKVIETIIKHLPLSDVIKHQITAQREIIERYKGLYDEKSKSTEDFVTKWGRIGQETVACVVYGTKGCEEKNETDANKLNKNFAEKEQRRAESWWKKQ